VGVVGCGAAVVGGVGGCAGVVLLGGIVAASPSGAPPAVKHRAAEAKAIAIRADPMTGESCIGW